MVCEALALSRRLSIMLSEALPLSRRLSIMVSESVPFDHGLRVCGLVLKNVTYISQRGIYHRYY